MNKIPQKENISNKAYLLLKENNFDIDKKDVKDINIFKFLHEALKNNQASMDEVLDLDLLDKDDFYEFVSKTNKIEEYDLSKIDTTLNIDDKIDTKILKEKLIFPVKNNDHSITLATYNPYDKSIIFETMKRVGKNVTLVLAKKEQLQRNISEILINRELNDLVSNARVDLHKTDNNNQNIKEESGTVKILELVLTISIQNRASDIHLEFNNSDEKAYIRFRIDGVLYDRFKFDKEIYLALSSTLKLFSNIDFVNTTKAQDGRFSYTLKDNQYDFRVSVIPLFNGESISVRILRKKNLAGNLIELGLPKESFNILDRTSKYPHGLILITGPTGSGKTTTLYSILSSINDSYKKIITVEDPVEYELDRIQQIQVKIRSDINFVSILKSILRHDPDIIMIGEIRDNESLKIAVESALTGHLVFTTLHTNDSISSIIRLKEMGVEDYLIANSLLAVHSQRLVRKLCQSCLKEHTPNKHILKEIKNYLPKDYKFYFGEGCNDCAMTGFSGRTIISETVFINQELSSSLSMSSDYATLKQIAVKNGFISMVENGIQKALQAETSLDEIIRAVYI